MMRLKEAGTRTLAAGFAAKFRCLFVLVLPVFGFCFSGSGAPAEDTVQYQSSPQVYIGKDAVVSNSNLIYTTRNSTPETSVSENKTVPTIYITKGTSITGLENFRNARIAYTSSSNKEKRKQAKFAEKIDKRKKSIEKIPQKDKVVFVAFKNSHIPDTYFNASGACPCSGAFSGHYKLFFPQHQKLNPVKPCYKQSVKVAIGQQVYITSVYPNTASIRPPPQTC